MVGAIIRIQTIDLDDPLYSAGMPPREQRNLYHYVFIALQNALLSNYPDRQFS